MGIREHNGKIKAILVNATNKKSLQRTITDNVETSLIIYTDDHRAYIGLQGYTHCQ